MDGDDKLLAAFQVECVEHLESIRAGLAAIKAGDGQAVSAELDDAFRRAHSLKGAARLVGATGAEKIAHRLETLFSQLRSGALCWDREIIALVQLALDAIEDAKDTTSDEPLPDDALRLLTELDLLSGGQATPAEAAEQPSTLEQRLRAAFEEEYHGYLGGLIALADEVEQAGHPSAAALEEACRCAHSLKGAARAASVPGVDMISESLDAVLSQVRRGSRALDRALAHEIRRAAQSLTECIAAPPDVSQHTAATIAARLAGTDSRPGFVDDDTAIDQTSLLSGRQPGSAEMPAAPVETVRLNAESLDRLLELAGEFMSEGLKQDLVAQQLNLLRRQLSAVEGQWATLKKAAGAKQKSEGSNDLDRSSHATAAMDHQFHAISRLARSVCLSHRQSAWSLLQFSNQLQRDIRRTRMLPADCVFQGLRKLVRDLARDEGKQIDFQVIGFDVEADRVVLQALKDPLMHVLRNAVSHGIEPPEERLRRGKSAEGVVSLKIEAESNRLTIVVEDDGRGIDFARTAQIASRRQLLPAEDAASPEELARVLFQPGVSTATAVTELSGRGMGLSVVEEAVSRLQGEVKLRPGKNFGTALWLSVPLTVSTHRLLLAACRGQVFAIPLNGIACLERRRREEIVSVEGRPMMLLDGHLTPLATLAQLVEIDDADTVEENKILSLVVLQSGSKRLAVIVDALLAERDALVKSLGPPAASLSKFAGGILLEEGSVALVLSPAELIQSFRPSQRAALQPAKAAEPKPPPSILVVDDSFTTRTLETSILETHGYRVRVAVDGIEALSQLRAEKVDLVITDIQMPRLDGFGLLDEIRKDPRLSGTPVIVVSSVEQRDHQQRGLDLGADAYIVKRKFDHQELLRTIEQIL